MVTRSFARFLGYYQASNEYDLIVNKYPFHDSGIADEGLSDETGSVDDDSNNQENQSGKTRRGTNDTRTNRTLSTIHTDDKKSTPKKPSQSYLEIIAEAILKAPNRMMQLYEIYTYFQRKSVID
jgi:hypothetical protein